MLPAHIDSLTLNFALSKRSGLYELQPFSMSQMIQQVHSTLKEIDVPLTKELFQTKCPIFQHRPHDMVIHTSLQSLYKANPGL